MLVERLGFEEASDRAGYQESGEFDKDGEFGETGDLTKVRWKDLDLREVRKRGVSEMRRIRRKRRIWRNWRFDVSSPERHRFEGASKTEGYQKSGEYKFEENNEFGKTGDFTIVCRKDLDLSVRG